jgi:hypothetical protein
MVGQYFWDIIYTRTLVIMPEILSNVIDIILTLISLSDIADIMSFRCIYGTGDSTTHLWN